MGRMAARHNWLLAFVACLVWAGPSPGFQAITGGGSKPAPPDSTKSQGGSSIGVIGSGKSAAPRNVGGGDTGTQLIEMAEAHKHAVGVIIVSIPGVGPVPVGTVWAFEAKRFATNAHVVEAVADLVQQGKQHRGDAAAFVLINGRPEQRLRVTGFNAHPKYGQESVNFRGVPSTVTTNDVGIVEVAEPVEHWFRIASPSDLKQLRAGYRVAYLGFPMEGLNNSNLDVTSPVATMQSGIISAVSDYWNGDSGFEKNLVVRHNLAATGGASGSPIFNSEGKVVGLLSAGNVEINAKLNAKGEVELRRGPSAALVNFGMRADLLNALR